MPNNNVIVQMLGDPNRKKADRMGEVDFQSNSEEKWIKLLNEM